MTAVYLDAPEREWPGELLNANSLRGQTRYFGRLSAPWRTYGLILGRRAARPGVVGPVRVWVEFTFPTNHRRDVANLYPTVKALLDGIVDAGLISDDRDGLIEGPFLRRIYPNRKRHLRVVIEQLQPDELGRPHGEEK